MQHTLDLGLALLSGGSLLDQRVEGIRDQERRPPDALQLTAGKVPKGVNMEIARQHSIERERLHPRVREHKS